MTAHDSAPTLGHFAAIVLQCFLGMVSQRSNSALVQCFVVELGAFVCAPMSLPLTSVGATNALCS